MHLIQRNSQSVDGAAAAAAAAAAHSQLPEEVWAREPGLHKAEVSYESLEITISTP